MSKITSLLALTASLFSAQLYAQAPASMSEVDSVPQAPAAVQPMVLPLPQGQQMVFIPVEVLGSSNIFAYRDFKSGSGNFPNEPIMPVKLAGTLFDGAKWYIPYCETEVTRAQYAAVMGLPMPPQKEQQLPMVNISATEVQVFLSKLNELMLRDAEFAKALARFRNEKTSVFFCRLPSPIEWEFAARGGTAVDEGIFDRDYPYEPSALSRHEVLHTGSRNPAARSVKGRRLPNPLGLYDMLGNVSEWVSPIYYFDSSMGRSGGLLACGGNFLTEKTTVHASDRTECLPFREDGSEFRSNMIGFRPVIGSVIRHKQMSLKEFNDEWKSHVEVRTPQAPTPTATAEVCLEELVSQCEKEKTLLLQRVTELEKAAGTKTDLDKRAKIIASQLEQAQALVRQSYRLQTESALLMLSTSAAHLSNYHFAEAQLNQLVTLQGSQAGPQVHKKLQQVQANIKGARNLLYKGCRLLAEVSPEIVEPEVQQYKAALLSENKRQHQCLLCVLEYFYQYKATGKFPDPDALAKELLSIAEQQ